jgi:hypothetical protein
MEIKLLLKWIERTRRKFARRRKGLEIKIRKQWFCSIKSSKGLEIEI